MEIALTLFVGTYGNKVYKYTLDPTTLESKLLDSVTVENSSYITLGERGLYAITESGDKSAISAISTGTKEEPKLELINTRTDIGKDPCYIIHHKGYLLTADYSGGSISVFPTDSRTMAILLHSQIIAHSGNGPNSKRQQSSHIHSVKVVPNSDYLLAPDLGSDKIWIHKMEFSPNNTLNLTNNPPQFIKVPDGSGPRHLDFHKSKDIFYVLNELSGKIIAYKYVINTGGFSASPIQEIQADTTDAQASADIHISPDGKFLYSSHRRKNDGIAIFKIEESGELEQVGYINTAKHPRNFTFTSDGNIMLVASKDEELIQIFKVDKETGLPTFSGKTIQLKNQQPVCLVLVEL